MPLDKIAAGAVTHPIVTVAAAATTEIGNVRSDRISVTGAGVSITSFGTTPNALRFVTFAGANTIVDSANLDVGSGNYTTVAGETLTFGSDGDGKWKLLKPSVVVTDVPSVTSGVVISALGYTPADAEQTALASHLHDGRYVRSVNGVTPDGSGNAQIAVPAPGVSDVRLGSTSGSAASGHVLTNTGTFRPVQKYVSVSGTLTWVTVSEA